MTGERLPASAQAAVEVESNVVRRCTNDTPAVLIGISSGGALAYGIASHLESMGLPVAAVVLMDTYPFRSATYDENHMYAVYGKMFEDSKLRRYLTDTRVTAMAWYARLFMDWGLQRLALRRSWCSPAILCLICLGTASGGPTGHTLTTLSRSRETIGR